MRNQEARGRRSEKMKQLGNGRKKFIAVLLAIVMSLMVFPQLNSDVYAHDTRNKGMPDDKQFATKEQLKAFNTDDEDGIKKSVRVNFGGKSWWVVGNDPRSMNGTDNIVLFDNVYVAHGINEIAFFEHMAPMEPKWDWESIQTLPDSDLDISKNHYGESMIRDELQNMAETIFTEGEQKFVNTTKLYTDGRVETWRGEEIDIVYSTMDKLYLAYGKYGDKEGYVTVGTNSPNNLNDGLKISKYYLPDSDFWLRAPNWDDRIDRALCYGGYGRIGAFNPIIKCGKKASFELDMSEVNFGSLVPSISSEGDVKLKYEMTLRYNTDSLGHAQITIGKSKVNLENVPEGTFLVVQNSERAYAKQITNETSVSAQDMNLTSFDNCKVWLEKTDKENRITYAELATEQNYSVGITGNTGLSLSDNTSQTVAPDVLIGDISIEAEGGYYFSDDYLTQLNTALKDTGLVAEKTESGYVIKGTPTKDVNVKLPPATAKTTPNAPNVTGGIGSTINLTDTTMEYASSETSDLWIPCTENTTESGAGIWYVRYKETATQNASPATKAEVIAPDYTIVATPDSLIFDDKNEGYENSPSAQSVTVTNTGNSKVTLEQPISFDYEVSLSKKELEPNGTAILTIAPKNGLRAGKYEETIEIKSTQGTSASVKANFKVNGAFTVSLDASATNIVQGENVTLTATTQGGSGNYSYTWYANDKEATELTKSQVTVSPIVTTTYKVIVTDTIENREAAATVTVVPKNYDLEVPDDFTFDKQHLGYKDTFAKSFSITNSGNVDVKNVNVDLTGTNADAFKLDTAGMQSTLTPKETTAFVVKPIMDLSAGTYTAELQITGEGGIAKMVAISFIVEDHEYEEKVTPPTCTEKGYTTHTCKICRHSYKDNEVDALTHDFGEWEVIKKATEKNDGEKARKCERCGAEEREIIPMTGGKTSKDKANAGKTSEEKGSVKTGDRSPVGVYTFIAAFSVFLIVVLSFLKKSKK